MTFDLWCAPPLTFDPKVIGGATRPVWEVISGVLHVL